MLYLSLNRPLAQDFGRDLWCVGSAHLPKTFNFPNILYHFVTEIAPQTMASFLGEHPRTLEIHEITETL